MNKLLKRLDKIIRNKRKLAMFLFGELCIFTVLMTALIYTIIKRNNVVEIAEVASVEIEQNETPEIIEEEEEEQAQELTEEQQEKAEEEENLEKKKDNKQNAKETKNNSSQVPSGYSTSYYIKVNYGANVVTIYTKGADGSYTPIKAMVCSTGRATPKSGTYSLKSTKHRWGALFGGVWGQYTTQIVGNILFHSVPYLSANSGNLEYWEYDKLGTTASAGCVRLRVCDAKWIYECMPAGTPVEFYSDSNPGPLGKPGAQKISGNEACRGWDPTDPSANNPWKNAAQEPAPQPTPTPAPQPQNNNKQVTPKTEQPKEEKKQETEQNKENNKENNEENKGKEETPKQNEQDNKSEEQKTSEQPKQEEKPKDEATDNKDKQESENQNINVNTNT